jgi:hypothetical protein
MHEMCMHHLPTPTSPASRKSNEFCIMACTHPPAYPLPTLSSSASACEAASDLCSRSTSLSLPLRVASS